MKSIVYVTMMNEIEIPRNIVFEQEINKNCKFNLSLSHPTVYIDIVHLVTPISPCTEIH